MPSSIISSFIGDWRLCSVKRLFGKLDYFLCFQIHFWFRDIPQSTIYLRIQLVYFFEHRFRLQFFTGLQWNIIRIVHFSMYLIDVFFLSQVIGDDVVFFIKTLSLTIHGTVALYLYCYMAQIVNDLVSSNYWTTTYLLVKQIS